MAEESQWIENEVYNDPIFKTRSSTQLKVVKLRHIWTIHNFSFCCKKTGEKLISPTFSARKNQWNDKSEWYLELYPKGEDDDSSNYISVFIKSSTSNLKEIQTKFKLGIVNVSGADTNIHDKSAKFDKEKSTWGFPKFVMQDFLNNKTNKILVDDNVTIFCEITIQVGIENIPQTLTISKNDLSNVLHVNKYFENEYRDPLLISRSSTQIQTVKFRHTWTVHNFYRSSEEIGKKLISPAFSAGKNQWNDESTWCLWLYPSGEDLDSSEYVGLYLVLNTCHVDAMQAHFELGIVNADGNDIKKSDTSYRFNKDEAGYGWNNFLKWNDSQNQKDKVVLDDKLIIYCEITATACSDDTAEIQSDLSNGFSYLLENSELSDITLSAGGKEFPAHKVILAAQSPVFRAMFKHNMVESRENRVEITDLDEEGLGEMLRYMYTGEIQKLKETAPRLLGVAEKYAMDGLKIRCEKALVENLSVENAAETFILSDTFRATELKNRVKLFIVGQAEEVGYTSGFESMVRTHPHLGVEAFRVLSNPSIVL